MWVGIILMTNVGVVNISWVGVGTNLSNDGSDVIHVKYIILG